jgi:TonB family protein
MTTYIIQSSACLLLFWLAYEFWFRKETFYQWNRIYLLVTPLLSMILPFLSFDFLQEMAPQTIVISLPEVVVGSGNETQAVLPIHNFIMPWQEIWFAGMLVFSMRLLFKFFKLKQILQKGKRTQWDAYTLVELDNRHDAFSFGSFIVLGKEIQGADKAYILQHESIHLRQKHSLDLIFFEVLRVVFWFNPLLWIYQKRLIELHEFYVDRIMHSQNEPLHYTFLLNQIFEVQNFAFTNSFFNKSLIQKRLLMLRKNPSGKAKRMKFALLLPLVFGMLFYVSCQNEAKKLTVSEQLDELLLEIEQRDSGLTKEETKKLMDVIVKGVKIDPNKKSSSESVKLIESIDTNVLSVPFAVIDRAPVFPGCEGLELEEGKNCFQQKMEAHIRENFQYPMEAQENGIEGRVYVQFTINENGLVEEYRMRGPDPLLEEEAARIVKLLPKFEPGEQKGEPVKVPFSIPINFKLQ